MVKNELLMPGQDIVSYQEQKPIITTYHPLPIMHRQPFTLLHHCYSLSALLYHQTTTIHPPPLHHPLHHYLPSIVLHPALSRDTVLQPCPAPSPTKSVNHLPPLWCTTSSQICPTTQNPLGKPIKLHLLRSVLAPGTHCALFWGMEACD